MNERMDLKGTPSEDTSQVVSTGVDRLMNNWSLTPSQPPQLHQAERQEGKLKQGDNYPSKDSHLNATLETKCNNYFPSSDTSQMKHNLCVSDL